MLICRSSVFGLNLSMANWWSFEDFFRQSAMDPRMLQQMGGAQNM